MTCPLCNDTGYKDHASMLCLDPCGHGEGVVAPDTEEDQRCPECGFLACICFDDDEDHLEDDGLADDCMMGPDGYCGAAGSEYCDWECPIHNSYFGRKLTPTHSQEQDDV